MVELKVSEFKETSIKFIQSEQQKENRWEKWVIETCGIKANSCKSLSLKFQNERTKS
jgi:hypothetical protein